MQEAEGVPGGPAGPSQPKGPQAELLPSTHWAQAAATLEWLSRIWFVLESPVRGGSCPGFRGVGMGESGRRTSRATS